MKKNIFAFIIRNNKSCLDNIKLRKIVTQGGFLQTIMKNNIDKGGILITSSPSFINPRGYIWMTLQLLFDVPMSLSDLHFLCPFDFERFADEFGYSMEMTTIDQDWANGQRLIIDFKKRLPNALRDAGMETGKVDLFLKWLDKAMRYNPENEFSGATMVYKISKS